MKISKIHEDICDYVDGVMDAERKNIFENFISNNGLVKCFVDDAANGKLILKRFSESQKHAVKN